MAYNSSGDNQLYNTVITVTFISVQFMGSVTYVVDTFMVVINTLKCSME